MAASHLRQNKRYTLTGDDQQHQATMSADTCHTRWLVLLVVVVLLLRGVWSAWMAGLSCVAPALIRRLRNLAEQAEEKALFWTSAVHADVPECDNSLLLIYDASGEHRSEMGGGRSNGK